MNDAMSAVNTLKENDFIANLTPVLVVEVPDEAGGLDSLLQVFAESEINIEYMYAFSTGRDVSHAYMIFRVADIKAAEAKLSGRGIRMLEQDDIVVL